MAAQPIPVSNLDNQTIADVLLSQRALTKALADRIKKAEVQSGKLPEDVIKEQNLVAEKKLTQARAVLYNVKYIDLDTIPISPDALSFVTPDVANRFHI